jgi:hypothetical protein
VSDPNGMTVSSNTILTVLSPVAPPSTNLVGAWITGAANLADVSGYTPAGTHDGRSVGANNYAFTNDVPPGVTGQSITFLGNTALAISNSSTLDAGYLNTYDDTINNAMTVTFWAKGLPGGWSPWVSKNGEGAAGWQLRIGNPDATPCWTVRDGGVGSYTLGNGPSWAPNGDLDDMHSPTTVDSNWHHYAGTFDATAGIRNLYVDGELKAQEIGNVLYGLSPASYVTIGGRDGAAGNSFGSYFTGKIYGVRIYNTNLSEAQVNFLIPAVPSVPSFTGPPLLNGNKLVLTWSGGTLLQATNVTGPWTLAGTTSPYTNDITTAPRMFFRLSNP